MGDIRLDVLIFLEAADRRDSVRQIAAEIVVDVADAKAVWRLQRN
jgi:hypothetical protein